MDAITREITKIVCECIGNTPVETDTSLFSVGIDSMNLLYIVNEIEICFSIKIPDDELLLSNFETIEQIVILVKRIKGDENETNKE